MTYEITIRMPDEIHQLLQNLKDKFRLSINSTIMTYVCRGLIADGLYPVSNLIPKNRSEQYQIDTNPIPEELKFCDGDKCEVIYK